MSGELMGVHVGQCGNQLASSFWKQLSLEHGIDANGRLTCEEKPGEDSKDAFFYEADDNHRVARAAMIDLEPRVINGVLADPNLGGLLNTDNIYLSTHGGGAGNNWANGYGQGSEVYEQILDILEREAENASRLDGFLFTHSVSGGTGSGLGSMILEKMNERFPKKMIQTYSVFANQSGGDGSSDVVVAPYNSVLSLERLIDHSDDVVILDNAALNRLAAGKFSTQSPTFDHINSLVTRIMSASTAPMRFNSNLISSIRGLQLSPYPPLKFIQAGFSPVVDPSQKFTRKTTVTDIVRYLTKPGAMMVSTATLTKKTHCMLSGLMLIQGSYDFEELNSVYLNETLLSSVTRAPWDTLNPLRIVSSPSSPYMTPQYKVSGLMLNNSTSVAPLFERLLSQFNKLRKKNAFIDRFEKENGFSLDMMDQSAERVQEIIELYKEAETPEFIN